ncbi:MAG: twin-arginine translocase subunit TatC, partial [Alphaproteobacteria bacterium]|nr:twin-arginine translocase subunit TatC [Alphaproteobacteria bacterium]
MSQKAKLKEQPLLDHLVELRNRLVWCVGFFSMAFMGCYFFSQEIFLFLTRPLINALDG